MIRQILCIECGQITKSNDEDTVLGWRKRKTHLILNSSLVCDYCNKSLEIGQHIIAETFWNINKEDEPNKWEITYNKEE